MTRQVVRARQSQAELMFLYPLLLCVERSGNRHQQVDARYGARENGRKLRDDVDLREFDELGCHAS